MNSVGKDHDLDPVTRSPGIGGTRTSARVPVDRQRTAFLRSCRARINPSDLGLPVPQRKRTEGLRREDVAALAGVSVSWYTWLEQGRDMRVSDDLLERICQTFKLSEDERMYLFSLVQRRPPRLHHARVEAPAEIVRMIHGVTAPAVVMNLRWDVLAWNRLNSLIFRDYGDSPASERNLIEILFKHPGFYKDEVEFERMARRVLAKLRVDYSKSGEDPRFEAMIRRLETQSPVFRRIWRTPEINVRSYGIHRFTHPRYGDLAFEHTSYVPEGHPTVRVVICTPDDHATRQAVAQLNSEIAQP
jgi:transcriptional regulator with XRE-family HTH domain